MDVRASAKITVMNVGTTKKAVFEESKNRIFVTHEPQVDDPSHAGINGITRENYRIIADILSECLEKPTYPARPPAE